MGDEVFNKFLRTLLSQYTDKSVRTTNVETLRQAQSNLELTAFFAHGSMAQALLPSPTNYSVFRLGDKKGFRTSEPSTGSRPFPHAGRAAHRNRRKTEIRRSTSQETTRTTRSRPSAGRAAFRSTRELAAEEHA